MAGMNASPSDETVAMILHHTEQKKNGVYKTMILIRKKWRKKGYPLGTPFDVVVAGL